MPPLRLRNSLDAMALPELQALGLDQAGGQGSLTVLPTRSVAGGAIPVFFKSDFTTEGTEHTEKKLLFLSDLCALCGKSVFSGFGFMHFVHPSGVAPLREAPTVRVAG